MKISLSLVTVLAVLLVVVAVGQPSGASAATITVDTTNDELNSDGDCSLREAITAANSDAAVDACTAGSGADTISLPAGTYTLTIAGTGEGAAATGDLDITESLTITGADKATTIIEAGVTPSAGIDRVFDVSGTVTISDVTVRNGKAPGAEDGGGIRNFGTLYVTDSVFEDNSGENGGGIENGGTLEVTRVTFRRNSALPLGGFGCFGYGGGINGGLMTKVFFSDFEENCAGEGGGIQIESTSATLTVEDSVFDANLAIVGAGIRDQRAETTLLRVTVKNHGNVGLYFETGGADSIVDSTITDNGTGVLAEGSSESEGVTISGSTITGNTYALNAGAQGSEGGGFIKISGTTLADNGTICSSHIWTEDDTPPLPPGEPALRIHDLGGNDVPNTDGDLAFDPCDPCPYGITAGIEVGVPPDEDCDGFGSTTMELGRASESFLGTDDDAICSDDTVPNNEPTPDRWPLDMNDDQRANTLDIAFFIPLLNSEAPGPPYDVRFDLNQDNWVNTLDIAKFIPFLNKLCSP